MDNDIETKNKLNEIFDNTFKHNSSILTENADDTNEDSNNDLNSSSDENYTDTITTDDEDDKEKLTKNNKNSKIKNRTTNRISVAVKDKNDNSKRVLNKLLSYSSKNNEKNITKLQQLSNTYTDITKPFTTTNEENNEFWEKFLLIAKQLNIPYSKIEEFRGMDYLKLQNIELNLTNELSNRQQLFSELSILANKIGWSSIVFSTMTLEQLLISIDALKKEVEIKEEKEQQKKEEQKKQQEKEQKKEKDKMRNKEKEKEVERQKELEQQKLLDKQLEIDKKQQQNTQKQQEKSEEKAKIKTNDIVFEKGVDNQKQVVEVRENQEKKQEKEKSIQHRFSMVDLVKAPSSMLNSLTTSITDDIESSNDISTDIDYDYNIDNSQNISQEISNDIIPQQSQNISFEYNNTRKIDVLSSKDINITDSLSKDNNSSNIDTNVETISRNQEIMGRQQQNQSIIKGDLQQQQNIGISANQNISSGKGVHHIYNIVIANFKNVEQNWSKMYKMAKNILGVNKGKGEGMDTRMQKLGAKYNQQMTEYISKKDMGSHTEINHKIVFMNPTGALKSTLAMMAKGNSNISTGKGINDVSKGQNIINVKTMTKGLSKLQSLGKSFGTQQQQKQNINNVKLVNVSNGMAKIIGSLNNSNKNKGNGIGIGGLGSGKKG